MANPHKSPNSEEIQVASSETSSCSSWWQEDKSWKADGSGAAGSPLVGLVAGPWNTCLAVDGRAQNAADLELFLGGSSGGFLGTLVGDLGWVKLSQV